jgi:diacylglycerol kinase family enzyme
VFKLPAVPDRIVIFANPIAGKGRGRSVALDLSRGLTAAGYAVDVVLDQATEPLRRADVVITVGGDGTLRAAVDRLIEIGGDLPAVLPVPMGTANLMGRHLGVSWTAATLVPAVVATVRQRRVRRLDAGVANGRPFLLMVGIGLDGQVVHLLDQMRHGPIAYASYVVPTILTLAGYRFPPLTVVVDGTAVASDVPAVAFVGNVREYGTGLPILTRAVPDDGLLDVCVLPCRDLRGAAEVFLAVAQGEHPQREGVVYTRGRRIRVTSAVDVPVQADGDSAGFTPVEIDVLPGRVPFLVPV